MKQKKQCEGVFKNSSKNCKYDKELTLSGPLLHDIIVLTVNSIGGGDLASSTIGYTTDQITQS